MNTSTNLRIKNNETNKEQQNKKKRKQQSYLDPMIFLADSLSYSSSLVPLSICIDEAVFNSLACVNDIDDHMVNNMVTQIHIDLIFSL